MKKRIAINQLKAQISLLQKQLTVLQGDNPSPSRSKSKDIGSKKGSQDRIYRSPTFWGGNPILHQNKYSPQKVKKQESKSRSQTKQQAKRSISPRLRQLHNIINLKSYQKPKVSYQRQKDILITSSRKKSTQRIVKTKRFQNSQFGNKKYEQIKDKTIRTYTQKPTDIILNPQSSKSKGIKVFHIQKSPQKMLTENPHSNPRLVVFNSKPVVLQRKKIYQQKNTSKINLTHSAKDLIQLFETKSRLNMTAQRPKKSTKKHFSQYFDDTFMTQNI